MKQHIVFTGGGTAGHVTPNLALIEELQQEGWQIDYIGSKFGVEKDIIKSRGIAFHAVPTGKMRRYFSWQTFAEPFKIVLGIGCAYRLLKSLKADVVFSKGGFVAFPVVLAAWFRNIPVVAHESDNSPGLANRLSFPFVNKICLNFESAKKHFKNPERTEVTGTPIRQQFFLGDKLRGLARCGFHADKPCLLVIGGSQGAQKINVALREALPTLTERYQVIHICGKGKLDPSFAGRQDYIQWEYVDADLPDFFAAADLVVSRSGANTLCEILALQKPHVLIPLSAKVSRGDQVQNARYFKSEGISTVLDDEALTAATLLAAIDESRAREETQVAKMKQLDFSKGTTKILRIIKEILLDKEKKC